eukprot:2370601-Rhodomonas_salina.1
MREGGRGEVRSRAPPKARGAPLTNNQCEDKAEKVSLKACQESLRACDCMFWDTSLRQSRASQGSLGAPYLLKRALTGFVPPPLLLEIRSVPPPHRRLWLLRLVPFSDKTTG